VRTRQCCPLRSVATAAAAVLRRRRRRRRLLALCVCLFLSAREPCLLLCDERTKEVAGERASHVCWRLFCCLWKEGT
jgi:hypothetical protein